MSSSRAFIILLASTCSEFMCFFKWCQISGNGWVCTTGIWIFPWETHTSVWVLGTGSTLVSSSTTRWVWPTPCGITQHPRPARPTFGCPRRSLEGPSPPMPMPRTCRRSELFEVGRSRGEFLGHWGGGLLLGSDLQWSLVRVAMENHQGKHGKNKKSTHIQIHGGICCQSNVNPGLLDYQLGVSNH